MSPEHACESGIEGSPLIKHYEAIAAASRRMLEAARNDDWDKVEREEERCRMLIGTLRRVLPERSAPPVDRRQRLALLRTILSDDAEIRELSEPWLKQLEALLGRSPNRGA